MSYCRFGADGSDVYIYPIMGGGYCCDACGITEDAQTFFCDTGEQMIVHIRDHREVGHTVPEYAVERLQAENGKYDRKEL